MNSVAAGLGLVADAAFGEPPTAIHPVAAFGKLMARIERRTYAPRRIDGAAHTMIGLAAATTVGIGLQRTIGSRPATAIAVGLCSAGRMLDREAATIADLLAAGNLDAARQRLPILAGRDHARLGEQEITRAVIESIAENGVDAVTATVWWAVVGGAPASFAHRAVNTLDAMIGHRNERYERFGWAAARLDDAVNFIPARLTAVAVAVCRPRRAREILRTVRADGSVHPSPNGGVVEAAFAAALDVRLGGTNTYDDIVEFRGTLGDGRVPQPSDIHAAIALRRQSTLVLTVGLIAVTSIVRLTRRRRR